MDQAALLKDVSPLPKGTLAQHQVTILRPDIAGFI